jgi:hypothetical protein
MNKRDYEFFMGNMQISSTAFQKAKEENRKAGLPNVYANDKGLYFEMPDGSITTKNPLK